MSTIKLDVELSPAYVLGKRHSTHATIGGLRTTGNTKAEALAQITADVHAVLRYPEPAYRSGETSGRIYALSCQGSSPQANGTAIYSWLITILDLRKRYPASGGMSFGAATEREALQRLAEYVESCESAHESPTAPTRLNKQGRNDQ